MTSGCTFLLQGATARELTVTFVCGEYVRPAYFRLLATTPEDVSLAWSPEAQVIGALIPAMRRRAPLQIEGALEASFLDNLTTVQTILALWVRELGKVAINATVRPVHEGSLTARQALFFGGGVDSMFSLLRHAGCITDLIYVHGFDVPLAETATRSAVTGYLHQVAKLFNINLIEVETNLRELLDAHADWRLSHGTALAVVGHLFPQVFSRIYIPSTYSYDKLQPCGTHPLLDPLWSTSATTFIHDGAGTTRADKTATIARHAAARRCLRVCWMAPRADRLNCCHCEKCLRTMVALQAAGELHTNEAFSLPIEYARVRSLRLDSVTKDLWQENRALLLSTGHDPALLATVERLLEPNPFARLNQRIRVFNKQRRAVRRQRRAKRTGE